jgi:hypothetical protein
MVYIHLPWRWHRTGEWQQRLDRFYQVFTSPKNGLLNSDRFPENFMGLVPAKRRI